MDPKTVVLEISSDEEGDCVTREGTSCDNDDFGWISELLDDADERKGDSDDVVFVSEVVSVPKQRAKSSLKDTDDDCVVLDGDPDKPVGIDNGAVDDSDDLLVVSEKGQVACRDYPHARHLCALFPFTSTPHEKHCELCHCFVCDSLAPCVHWGLGISSIDHCHATDKEEFWKNQRKSLKKSVKSFPEMPKAPGIALPMGLPLTNQVPSLTLPINTVPQNCAFSSTSMRACSMPARYGIPGLTNQDRSLEPGCTEPRNKFQSYLVSQQLLGTRNNVIPRNSRNNAGHLGPQLISPRAMFKKTGSVGVALTTGQRGYSSSNNNHATQYSRNPPSLATPRDRLLTRLQNSHGGTSPQSNTYWRSSRASVGSITVNSLPHQVQSSSQPNVGSIFANSLPSQPRVSSLGSAFTYSVPSQPQAHSQSHVGSTIANSVASQPQIPSIPNVGCTISNSVSFQPQICSLPDVVCTITDSVSFQPQLSAIPNVGSNGANSVASQSPVYNQFTPVSNVGQNVFHEANQTQSSLNPSFTDFDVSWANLGSQSNQQPLSENSRHQIAEQTDKASIETQFDPHYIGNTDLASLDFGFESLLWENPYVCNAPEISVPPGSNVLSPEPPPVNTGIFDF